MTLIAFTAVLVIGLWQERRELTRIGGEARALWRGSPPAGSPAWWKQVERDFHRQED